MEVLADLDFSSALQQQQQPSGTKSQNKNKLSNV